MQTLDESVELTAADERSIDDLVVDALAAQSATAEEAAAIIAAIRTVVDSQGDGSVPPEEHAGWNGKRWAFAGRISRSPSRRFQRIPSSAPSNPWTASGRVDRF